MLYISQKYELNVDVITVRSFNLSRRINNRDQDGTEAHEKNTNALIFCFVILKVQIINLFNGCVSMDAFH